MSALTDFHFLRPLWLIALLPAVLLWWAYRRQADSTRRWLAVIDPALLRHLTVGAKATGRLRPGDGLLAAWVIGTLAVAGPAWQREPSPFAGDSPPVMLVLRITPSMQTGDLQPTRLQRAQQKIEDLLTLQPRQAAGLIAYAGSAHLVLPPTRDSSVVITMARALSPEVMPKQGDALADAIALARKVLADGGEGGSVLLLADEASPEQAAALRSTPRDGPPVTVLAMLPQGMTIPAGLQQATTALGARIEAATIDQSDVTAIGRSLARASATVTRPGEQQRWRDAGWYLTPLLALIVLLWFRRGWAILS
jgi:Ca-activated chloride channel family protein